MKCELKLLNLYYNIYIEKIEPNRIYTVHFSQITHINC